MSNLYHKNIYKFDEPVKSYWESTYNTKNKYNKLEKNKQTNILVIGAGMIGSLIADQLSKDYSVMVIDNDYKKLDNLIREKFKSKNSRL